MNPEGRHGPPLLSAFRAVAVAAAAAILLGLSLLPSQGAPADARDGFIPIFDGKTFNGWKAPDMSWWSIEDGAITARITAQRPCTNNQYLVWQMGELADFELKLLSRVNGDGAINNGFQFRSRVLPDGDVAGYQVDNNLQTEWLVRLYDEFGRHTLAFRGKRSVFDTQGRVLTTDLKDASGPAWFKLENWHEYHLICRGPTLTLRIDGRPAAEVEDHESARSDLRGALALQLHSGPPTVVQFKDIRLNVLRPPTAVPEPRWTRAESSGKRKIVLSSAVGYWDLGVGGHGARIPLKQAGDSDFDVRAEGPASLHGSTVAELRSAWFDAGTQLNLSGPALTIYLRVREPAGKWNQALYARRGPGDRMNFLLHGTDLPETPGPNVVFEVRGASGNGRIGFPVSRFDPSGWHDLVGRYDGAKLDILCDGVLMARRVWSGGPLLAIDAPLFIGADGEGGTAGRAATAQVEEAAVWQKALPDADLAALMRVREIKGGGPRR